MDGRTEGGGRRSRTQRRRKGSEKKGRKEGRVAAECRLLANDAVQRGEEPAFRRRIVPPGCNPAPGGCPAFCTSTMRMSWRGRTDSSPAMFYAAVAVRSPPTDGGPAAPAPVDVNEIKMKFYIGLNKQPLDKRTNERTNERMNE